METIDTNLTRRERFVLAAMQALIAESMSTHQSEWQLEDVEANLGAYAVRLADVTIKVMDETPEDTKPKMTE